jgi:hypothetical protein
MKVLSKNDWLMTEKMKKSGLEMNEMKMNYVAFST